MEHRLTETRKSLSVDILEDDGTLTRGYVQDVLKNGTVVVQFDRKRAPTSTLRASSVFDLRKVEPECSYFVEGDKVELLLRLSSDRAQRWYPATVLTDCPYYPLVSVTLPDGSVRRRLLESREETDKARYAGAKKKHAQFAKLRLEIPTEMEQLMKTDGRFVEQWQKATRSRIMHIEKRKPLSRMELLLPRSSCLAAEAFYPDRVQKHIVLSLRDDGSPTEAARLKNAEISREAGLDADSGSSKEAGGAAERALCLPEIVSRIAFFMDENQRNVLWRVSSTWYGTMKLRDVRSIARIDLAQYEPKDPRISRVPYSSALAFYRCFSRHLTTLVITGKSKASTKSDTIKKLIQLLDIPCVTDALRTIVLTGISVKFGNLTSLLDLGFPASIVLRKVEITHIEFCGGAAPYFQAAATSGHLHGITVPTLTDQNERRQFCNQGRDIALNFVEHHLNMVPLGDWDRVHAKNALAVTKNLPNIVDVLKRFDPAFYREGKKNYQDLDSSALRPVTVHFLRRVGQFDHKRFHLDSDDDC